MSIDREASNALLHAFHNDREAFLEEHKDKRFLPPLAPEVMLRLGRCRGSIEEIAYYERTQQFMTHLLSVANSDESDIPF